MYFCLFVHLSRTGSYTEHRMCRNAKIGVNVPHVRSERSSSCQLKRSKMKVIGCQKPLKMTYMSLVCLLMAGSCARCTLGVGEYGDGRVNVGTRRGVIFAGICWCVVSEAAVWVLAVSHRDCDGETTDPRVDVGRQSTVWAAVHRDWPLDRSDFTQMSAGRDWQRRGHRQAAEGHCRGELCIHSSYFSCLGYVISQFFLKLFRTHDVNIVRDCQ